MQKLIKYCKLLKLQNFKKIPKIEKSQKNWFVIKYDFLEKLV